MVYDIVKDMITTFTNAKCATWKGDKFGSAQEYVYDTTIFAREYAAACKIPIITEAQWELLTKQDSHLGGRYDRRKADV